MIKKLYAIANAHLDTQWNWTIQETIQSFIKNTLTQNFALLDKYPHYRMNFEGAFRYQIVKEYYPELYEKLKEYIAEGRWNVAGSAWEAGDTNIPSSESLMRQILYGNGFFQEEFGKRSTDLFLPDCFGFCWSVPSVAAHMGLVGFSTCKLGWGPGTPIYAANGSVIRPVYGQEYKRMDLGRWKGPDGSTVITTLMPGDYTYQFDADGDSRPVNRRRELLEAIEHNETYTGVAVKGKYYGTGDQGGGPGEACVKLLNDACSRDDGLYCVISASTDQLFNELTPEQVDGIPVYEGNLSIPHGFGSLTSRTICKRWNRKCELLANAAELANMMARIINGKTYPADRLRDAWKTFLCHQFHDDLPGTSCVEAYAFSYNDYLIALNMFAAELCAGVDAVASGLDTQTKGIPLLVFNPISVSYTALVSAEIDIFTPHVRVFTAQGQELPAQLSEENGKTMVFFTAELSGASCTVFDVRPSAAPCPIKTGLFISEDTVENQRYCVKVDQNGDICSVWDKRYRRELLSAPLRMEIGPDTGTAFPAWELNPKDLDATPACVSCVDNVDIHQQGPAVAALKIRRSYEQSEFIQTISLYAGSDRVDVDNEVQWQQRGSILRAAYPLHVANETAAFDQGLGTERQGNSQVPYYQYTVHQWADLTDRDGSYGISILNDCKYGMDKPDDNTLRLTLIHTPTGAFSNDSSQDWQDLGTNLFRFSLMGHAGAPDAVPAQAAAVNQPPLSFTTEKHSGSGHALSLLRCSHDEVLVRAVKQEETGERIILRVQETSGQNLSGVSVRFSRPIRSAAQTNGFEEDIRKLLFDGDTLTFDIGRYAPMTFAIELADCAPKTAPRGNPLALPYNKKVTSYNYEPFAGEFAKGISIPAELFRRSEIVGGIPFAMAPADEKNAVVCMGQKIGLPAGCKKLYLLAASANGDKAACFCIDGRQQFQTIQDFQEDLGTWDVWIANKKKHIKSATLGVRYTHTHIGQGDRPYRFAYLFRYCLDIDGGRELTLPDDDDILIFAMTAADSLCIAPAAALYDRANQERGSMALLTVADIAGSQEYRYPHNSTVLLPRHKVFDLSVGWFRGYRGDGVCGMIDGVTLVNIGTTDAVVTAEYEAVGTPVEFHVASCSANDYYDDNTLPAFALVEGPRKWCGRLTDGKCILEAALQGSATITGWYVAHAGTYEDPNMNSRDFSLEYRMGDGPWKIADTIQGNTESHTFGRFPGVLADRVRLCITKPAQNDDPFSRIYLFRVYSN